MPSAWPGTLPQRLLLAGARLGVGDGLLEYSPDIGPSITRRRTAAVMRPLVGSMMLTDAQMTIFETFFYTTIGGGSLPFTFPDPRTGATLLVKFTKQGLPDYAPQGADNYLLQMNLAVLP
jgi:hypothetical protein